MKLPCQIAEDLLALYEDQVCSPASREAVEEHLKECEACRRLLRQIRGLNPPEIVPEASAEERAVTRSFRKVRRRWRLSLAAVLMLIPLILLGFMGWNQYRGRGVCFTNLDDILIGRRFVKALEKGDYEKAAGYMNFDGEYQEVQELLSMTPEDCQPRFSEVSIDGSIFMVRSDREDILLPETSCGPEIWMDFIYCGTDWIPIPESIFLGIVSSDPHTERIGELYVVDGYKFCRLETRWGSFMVTLNTRECLHPEDELDCAYTLALLPEAMYRDMKPVMEQQAQEECKRLQALCAPVAHMDRDAFAAYMRQKYAGELKALSGMSLEYTGYRDAYWMDTHWAVSIGLRVNGSQDVSLDVGTRNGGAFIVSGHSTEKSSSLDAFWEILFPTWSTPDS